MSLQKLMMSAAATGALSFALMSTPAAAATTIVHVGTPTDANPYFYITAGTPTSSVITATFGATLAGASTPFDYSFQFTIPQNGLGSGNLSTSFSSAMNQLTISQVIIDGHSYTPSAVTGGQSLIVSGIPIHDGALNTIEVIGDTSSSAVNSTFSGNATFTAGVIPEPASWLMMIGGLGLAGALMRRRRAAGAFA